jgi:hypothetical protein
MDPVFFAVYFILLFSITAVVLVLYLIPLDIRFKIEHYGQITHISGLTAWGIFGVSARYQGAEPLIGVTLAGRTVFEKPILKAPSVSVIPSGPEEFPEKTAGLSFEKISGGLPETLPYLKKIIRASIRACSVKKLDCDLVIGLSGAAETGKFFGAWSAVRPLLLFFPVVSISVLPVFDRTVFEGRCELRMQVRRPADILVHVIRLMTSAGVRGIMSSKPERESRG